MYERIAENVQSRGARILLGHTATRISRHGEAIASIELTGPDNEHTTIQAKSFFSSIPLRSFFNMLNPAKHPGDRPRGGRPEIPATISRSIFWWTIPAYSLTAGFYVHSPEVRMARLGNYNNFSDAMVSNKNKRRIKRGIFCLAR